MPRDYREPVGRRNAPMADRFCVFELSFYFDGMFQATMRVYLWDLVDEGIDDVLDRLKGEAGITGICGAAGVPADRAVAASQGGFAADLPLARRRAVSAARRVLCEYAFAARRRRVAAQEQPAARRGGGVRQARDDAARRDQLLSLAGYGREVSLRGGEGRFRRRECRPSLSRQPRCAAVPSVINQGIAGRLCG